MSTNDTVLLQATGASAKPLPAGLLDAVLLQLAIEVRLALLGLLLGCLTKERHRG